MAYNKKNWQDNVSDITAAELNRMEQEIYDNSFKMIVSPRSNNYKWMKICNVKYETHKQGEFFYLKLFIGEGNNGKIDQNAYIELICQLAYINDPDTAGRFGCNARLYSLSSGFTINNTDIKVIANSNVDYDIWFYTSRIKYCVPNYIANGGNLATVTPKFELSDNAPTGTECNLNYSMFDDKMYYQSGESVTVINGRMCTGCISGGAKDIIFELTLDKKLTNINTITFSSLNIATRGVSGYVVSDVNGVQIVNNSDYQFVDIKITSEHTIKVDVQRNTAFSTANNTPVSVYINSCTMTLT